LSSDIIRKDGLSFDESEVEALGLLSMFAPKTKKQKKREIIAQNQAKGKAAEKPFEFWQRVWGNKVERTGYGSDYRVTQTSIWTGKKKTYLVEVKSGKGKLSQLQKKTKKRKKGNYQVKHVEPIFY
jgi:hypothetical protein